MNTFSYEKDENDIVVITMDMSGPVNAINDEFYREMSRTVESLESETNLSGVVFASAKDTFFAGGDLKMLMAMEPGDERKIFDVVEANKSLFRRLERLPVPVVAAINGAALGGGFELCLACNYRICVDDRRLEIGMPEASLGLLPGAGGIVRLTNLIGLESALPMLLEGKKLRPQQALAAGMVDRLVESKDKLLSEVMVWLVNNRKQQELAVQPWDKKGFKIPGGDIKHPAVKQIAAMAPHALLKKTRGLLPAPEAILDTAIQAVSVNFDTALRIESRKFASLPATPEAKNMMSAFFFQLNQVNSGVSRPDVKTKFTFKKIGVIGAGMMGQGIAAVAAGLGIQVVLKDISIEAAEKGKAYTAKLYDKKIAKGRATEHEKEQVLSQIIATDKDKDLSGCELIIEAVYENMSLKHKVLSDSEQFLSDNGVWASNTSTLPITQLAEPSKKPDNFIGLHFFSPVDKMPLVEIICGNKTSDETLARAFDFVQQIKKIPIVVNDSVGFFTSRTFAAQLQEASTMVSEGIHPVRVDNLGKAIGMPVGPLTVNDEVSLTIGIKVRETQIESGLIRAEDDRWPDGNRLIEKLAKEYNRGGRYQGDGGYYDYSDGSKVIWPKLLDMYHKPDLEISDQDIKDRLLFINVIESLQCLEQGVVKSVADANIGSIFGIGAPVWTGGYIQFVNSYGLERFKARCNELTEKYGERFKAPQIIEEKMSAGELFT